MTNYLFTTIGGYHNIDFLGGYLYYVLYCLSVFLWDGFLYYLHCLFAVTIYQQVFYSEFSGMTSSLIFVPECDRQSFMITYECKS